MFSPVLNCIGFFSFYRSSLIFTVRHNCQLLTELFTDIWSNKKQA